MTNQAKAAFYDSQAEINHVRDAAFKAGQQVTDQDIADVVKMARVGRAQLVALAEKTKAHPNAASPAMQRALSLARLAWAVAK